MAYFKHWIKWNLGKFEKSFWNFRCNSTESKWRKHTITMKGAHESRPMQKGVSKMLHEIKREYTTVGEGARESTRRRKRVDESTHESKMIQESKRRY